MRIQLTVFLLFSMKYNRNFLLKISLKKETEPVNGRARIQIYLFTTPITMV